MAAFTCSSDIIFDVTKLVVPDKRNDDDLDALRTRVTELEAALSERGAEVARMQSDLEAFRITYRQQVGLLHEQLDSIELEIAEAELGELSKRVAGGSADSGQAPSDARPSATPQFTSDAVRKLFRDVAKTIHPDLAGDDVARDRRHALMIEANRAYALGDEAQLRWILDAWERSPEAVQGNNREAMRIRFTRRAAQIEEQLDLLASELTTLRASPLGALKTMVDDAAAKGKDLVREMVTRLKRDIMVATNRLDAIRPPTRPSPGL